MVYHEMSFSKFRHVTIVLVLGDHEKTGLGVFKVEDRYPATKRGPVVTGLLQWKAE